MRKETREQFRIPEIKLLEDKWGLMTIRMSLTHLFDVGYKHITQDNVDKTKAEIVREAAEDKSVGIPVMTPEFQCNLLDCALELTKFTIMELFAYIKSEFEIG